ncbi:MAG: DUF2115 domain-containing protein [Methanobrevibacter sp.]|uniref:DUF2115 domain-containing protein n=1 Tax=Methanobrevibacter sp. TaxID=66852 RepID=UPI0025D2B359|nr:DUF2115 domain-containing protein [Methanobrevibacter sp.]MBR0270709.1 DUF2115 domain-containing protein [Methanobrevibacter sp.]
MGAEDILKELEKLMDNKSISKNDLMVILKEYAGIISPYDLMMATARMREDGKYVQSQYREKYLEIYIRYFIMRMKEVRDNNNDMNESIDMEVLYNSFPLLKTTFEKERLGENDDKFPLIYVITSLYTTFILEEPIHPVGSEFPGNLKVTEEKGNYFCPVKDNQKDNPNAICHLCLAEQTPNI